MIAFRTWHHDLNGCKYEFLVLIHQLIHQYKESLIQTSFLYPRALSILFLHWLLPKKNNAAIVVLSYFRKRNHNKKKTFKHENTKTFNFLQTLLTKTSIAELSLFSFFCLEKKNLLLLH